MDLAPLNPGVLLLVGETTNGPVGWVERAGMALDVRGPETEVHYDPAGFSGDPLASSGRRWRWATLSASRSGRLPRASSAL